MVSSADTPRARALAAMLKKAREDAKVSQRDLATRLGKTHPTIRRWEEAQTPISLEDASAYLACLGVVGDEREHILSLARSHDEDDWLVSGPGISQQLAGVMDCERTAIYVFEWAPLGIPGMMQTRDYAHRIISIGSPDLPRTDIETRVIMRLARRDALTRPEPMQFVALIGEPAIRARVGSSAIMAGQLRQVLDLAKRENVSLQVVSVTDEWHPGNMGPFIYYRFGGRRPDLVYVEHHRSGVFLVEEKDVADYETAAEKIRRAAMNAEDSAALIADAISHLETTI